MAGRNCFHCSGCRLSFWLVGKVHGLVPWFNNKKVLLASTFQPCSKELAGLSAFPSNPHHLQCEFASMGDSKPWRERSAPGSDGQIDTDLPPLVSIITARPVDLTKPDEQYRNCPRQYVWAARFDGCDQPKPDDADEICEMSMQHHSLLPFLQISPVGHQFPEPLYTVGYSMTEYLRWKLEFFHLDAAFVWDILGLPRDALQYFNANAKAVLKRLHPVFVEAHNGLHFGRWVNDICSRPTCASAFFIQAHGDQ